MREYDLNKRRREGTSPEPQKPIANKLTDESEMPFGMHQGKKMKAVPADYLLYLHEDGCRNAPVRVYIAENLSVIQSEVKDYISKKDRRPR